MSSKLSNQLVELRHSGKYVILYATKEELEETIGRKLSTDDILDLQSDIDDLTLTDLTQIKELLEKIEK